MVKLLLGILVLCSLGFTAAATAGQDSGVYVFGAAGQSRKSTITNENQDAFSLFLGYQFNAKWAIEGGYVDIGTSSYSGNISVGGATGTANMSTKSSATGLTAVRTWNVPDNFGNNGFSFLAKFGIAQVRSSASGSATIPTIFSASPDYSKKGVTFGLGARYDVDQNWAIRADADSYDTGQAAYGRLPVYTLGLSYKF